MECMIAIGQGKEEMLGVVIWARFVSSSYATAHAVLSVG